MHGCYPLAGERLIHHFTARSQARRNACAHKHIWFEPPIAVIHVHSDLYGSCFRIQHGIDKGNTPTEDLPRKCLRRKLRLLAVAKPLQVGLVGIKLDPDRTQIGDCEDSTACLDIHPFLRVFVDNHTARR